METCKIRCNGIRRVWTGECRPGCVTEAAGWFAAVLARREYGRRGTVGSLRQNSWSEDGTSHTYEAFVGYGPTQRERRAGASGITGGNRWLHLSVERVRGQQPA